MTRKAGRATTYVSSSRLLSIFNSAEGSANNAIAIGLLDDLERCRVFRALIDHLVDNAPLHCHFPGQEVVALERVLDLVETLLEIQDLLGMKHDVGRLALEAAGRLMQHDARVWEREPHVLLAGSQQQRCHGGGLADA